MTVKASGPQPAQVEGGEDSPLPLSHVLLEEYRALHGDLTPELDKKYRELEFLRPRRLPQTGLPVKLITYPKYWGVRPQDQARILTLWAKLPRATEEQDARVKNIEDDQLKIIYKAIHPLPLKSLPVKPVTRPKYWGVRPPDPQDQARVSTSWAKLRPKRSALCLSGGGIRSATFCLGVIQGLARRRLLGSFDYLSTVSGGGYIGSWLSAWIHRAGRQTALDTLGQQPKSTLNPEPGEISHLRSYSNYLSPRLGLLSADTWTLVSIYLRNLFLNWLMFLPLLLAILMIPRMYVALLHRNFGLQQILDRASVRVPLSQFANSVPSIAAALGWMKANVTPTRQSYTLLALGLLLGSIGLAYIGSHRPSLRRSPGSRFTGRDNLRRFLLCCMTPMGLSVILLTTGRAWYLSPERSWVLRDFLLFGAILHGLSWLITFVFVGMFFGREVLVRHLDRKRVLEGILVVITGALGGAFLWLLSVPEKINWDDLNPQKFPQWYATFDGPQLMLVFLLMAMLMVGLGRYSVTDEDREWWARAGAWVLIAITVWAALNSLVLFGPELFGTLPSVQAALSGSLLSLGLISGFVTILFGISSKTPANDRQAEKTGRLATVMNYGVKLAAPIFALFLVVVLSALTDLLIVLIKRLPEFWSLKNVDHWQANWLAGPRQDFGKYWHHKVVYDSSFLFLLCLFAALVLISLFMARRIDINQYSLHSMYRNRLVRAYLGASRRRSPNAFTGLDPEDDIAMADLWPGLKALCDGKAVLPVKPAARPTYWGVRRPSPQYQALISTLRAKLREAARPFHVVNMTWNLVQGKNLAWQNRKATTFTASPLHCGNLHYGYRSAADYGGRHPGSISLGTAFTISGAAASPNMGYYSSSAVTFLMTLFNARLGWWLGNPAKGNYRKRGPEWALKPMIDEAFGKTEADKEYIYLSDGGHFENLGLYEMVLRRCHHIFVVDASRDPDRMFENLGNAIRRIRVDLGVAIEIRGIVNKPAGPDASGAYCAVGDIRYGEVDETEGGGRAEDGLLVYIKPALTGDEPTDIFNYARAHLEFPHESTGDQFFSEQQFESYRALGLHAVEQIFKASTQGRDFSGLKDDLEKYLKASPGARGADSGTASGSDLV